MKKLVLLVLLIVTVTFAVFSQTGVIRELTGEVELKHAGSAAFITAQQGSTVSQDTIISTGFRSTALITIGSTDITVRSLTRLSLAEISRSAGTETLNVSLETGRVRMEVKPPAGTRANATVHSPSASASVRGTTFDMDVDGINVTEGRVVLQGSDGLNQSVIGGFTGQVNTEGSISNPAEIAGGALVPNSPGGGTTEEPSFTPSADSQLYIIINYNL
jgi:hypothetical protein